MQLLRARSEHLERWRTKWLQFIALHGNLRITSEAIRWIKQITPDELNTAGCSVLLAIEHLKLIGLCGVKDCGRSVCFVVVHRKYRGRHIGRRLMQSQIEHLPSLECRVALNNTASLRMCRAAGMSAVGFYQGAKQQPVVYFKTEAGGMAGGMKHDKQALVGHHGIILE